MGKSRSRRLNAKAASPGHDSTAEDNSAPSPIVDEAAPVEEASLGDKNASGEADEDPELFTDVVFQCGSCRSIVGDTLSDYRAHLESKTISLIAARSLKIAEKLEMSTDGLDVGCTYKQIECGNCRSVLGRVYGSTTPALDSCRETYTLDTTALVSYQLGSCRTMDGRRSHREEVPGGVTTGVAGGDALRRGVSGPSVAASVSMEAFDALDLHVGSLTEMTNKLSAALEQDRDVITQLKGAADVSGHAIAELRSGLEQAQNMMLVWEERFRRLEACEEKVEQLVASNPSLDADKLRIPRRESAARIVQSPPPEQQSAQRLPGRMKISPALRRPVQSPARTPLRRTPSASATPISKRRR